MMIANFCTLMHVNILNEAFQSWVISLGIIGPLAVIGLMIVPPHSDRFPPWLLALPMPWLGNLEYLSGHRTRYLDRFYVNAA